MVHVSTFFVAGLTLLSGVANALPRPDSSINEPAVSAPNGTPITDTSMPMATASSGSSSMSSSMGSGMSSDSSMSSDGSMSSDSSMSSGGSMSSDGGMSSDSSMSSGGSMSSDSSMSSGSSYGGSSSSGSSYGSGSSESWGSGDMSSGSYGGSSSSSSPSYGSGSSNWGNSGYNDCVQQCVASYGGLNTATYTPTATNTASSGGGGGATITVTVAPTQGVLRYVPFVVNASVGDTIQFMWGANNHTVTKSSELTICNKTLDNPFTSGEQNKGFVFTQVVNDTNPTFFYCGTPTHCQKGMFGIINPPNAFQAPTSMSEMMPSIAANSSDVMAYATYTKTQTKGNTRIAGWGMNIDMATLPEWSHQYVAENILYTQNFLAANPEVLKDDGSIDLSGNTPLMIPQDLSVVLAAASATQAASSAANTAAASATAAPSQPASNAGATPKSNGATSSTSSKMAVGFVAAVATLMML